MEKYAVFSFMNYVLAHDDFTFEKRVLMKVLGLRHRITRAWRRLHNNDLYDQYSSTNNIHVIKSRRTGWVGHDTYGRQERCIQVLMRKPLGERPHRIPRHRW